MIKSKFGNPPHHICSICNDDGLCRNNIFSSDYDIDFSDYLDCMGYIKSKKSKRNVILKFLKTIKIFSLFLVFVSCRLDSQYPYNDEIISNPIKGFEIELLNERGYPMSVNGNEYIVEISPSYQSIFKVKGITGSSNTERITWNTKNDYWWSNGLVVDEYWIVNPASYTKDGVGYSMVGLMPELKDKSIIIYGHYYSITDSIIIHIK